jgi:hypothetical protein
VIDLCTAVVFIAQFSVFGSMFDDSKSIAREVPCSTSRLNDSCRPWLATERMTH